MQGGEAKRRPDVRSAARATHGVPTRADNAASLAPTLSPNTSRWPSVFTPTATITATLTMRPASRVFTQVAPIHR